MDSLEKDLQFLAGGLAERQAQTDEEKRAAQYVTERLKPSTQKANMVDFPGLGTSRLLFPAYCGEFIVVSLVSFWWPTIAFFYGMVIFLAYMAEFIGYPVFSRLLPHYASSNAAGVSQSSTPFAFIVFTAYLDTDDNPLTRMEATLARFYLHYVVILAMVGVLAVCGIDALGAFYGRVHPHTDWMRWANIGLFTCFAIAGVLRAMATFDNPGANNNASGVTAMLHIADRLRENPIEHASVLFCATGSHFANMGGMRALLYDNPAVADTNNIYVINIEGVGAGSLHYTRAEGILHQTPCAPELVEAAAKTADDYDAASCAIHNRRTNAYLPLMRGARAISVLRLEDDGLPAHYGRGSDVCDNVDVAAIQQAALFAEAIGREVARSDAAVLHHDG